MDIAIASNRPIGDIQKIARRTRYGAPAELAFLNLLLHLANGLDREGGYDMHSEANSSIVQVLEDSNTGSSCSEGWNELEDGEELPNGRW